MRSKDLKAAGTARLLVIGEDSNLQWSDTATEYAMFADYYFRRFPEDHGERSRNVEARDLFNHITYVTLNSVKPEDMYITNLCNDYVEPAPKGKRVLIKEEKAIKGVEHIKWILEQFPTIEWILPMSLQTNYWLQKLGFYGEMRLFCMLLSHAVLGLDVSSLIINRWMGKHSAPFAEIFTRQKIILRK